MNSGVFIIAAADGASVPWLQLSLGVAGLAATLFIYFHKIKTDRKAQGRKQQNELGAWVAEIRHYAERSHAGDQFIAELRMRWNESTSKRALAKQEFPNLHPTVIAISDALRKYVDWVDFEMAFGEIRGPHAIGENRRLLNEITRLADQFEAEAKAKLK
jgi:hypothetical protein